MKTIKVKARSAVQLMQSDGKTLLPLDPPLTLEVEEGSQQMDELQRASESGLLSYEVVGESNTKTEAPKEEKKEEVKKEEPVPEEPKEKVEEEPEEPPKEEPLEGDSKESENE